MCDIFLKTVNMSIAAGWLILAVIVLRFLLKKSPKWVNVALWGIVALRLIMPVTLESEFSLIPRQIGSGELLSAWMDDYVGDVDIHHPASEAYDAAVDAGIDPISDGEGGFYVVTEKDTLQEPATVENTYLPVLANLWMVGVTLMGLYAIVSYVRLSRSLRTAVILRDTVFLSERIATPFVLGIFRPRIYLPYTLAQEEQRYVLAHEQNHIRRKDHWWKALGFLLLTIHWFNPLLWVAYILLCRDIELACDESVIRDLNDWERADYSQALLSCSVRHRSVAVCPLAFGEVGVKDRIRSIMRYQKPGVWLVALAVVLCALVCLCFLTDPAADVTIDRGAEYRISDTLFTHSPSYEENFIPADRYCVTDAHYLYEQRSGVWNSLGQMEEYTLDNQELYSYNTEGLHRHYPLRRIVYSYILRVDGDFFYLLFQTNNGNTYLAYAWEDVGERGQGGSDDTGLRRLYLLENTGTALPTWGITLTADDPSPEGVTVTMTQSGGYPPNRLFYGDGFDLMKYENGQWKDVPRKNTYISDLLLYSVPLDDSITWNFSWAESHGSLEPGLYRICKTVTCTNAPGDSEYMVLYAEFSIS